jgi:hypothetical protein
VNGDQVVTRKRAQARAQKRDLAYQALHLRASGATYKQIAQALELPNLMAAWRLVNQEIENTIRETAAEIVELELRRLDQMLMGIWPHAINGDHQAIDRALKIEDMRAKLLGLYDRAADAAPRGGDVEGVVIITGETSEEYIAGLRAMRGISPPPSNGNGKVGS